MVDFFDLPLPVREKIYRYTLVVNRIFVRPIVPAQYIENPNWKEKYGTPTRALLRTSKQVYEEANPIYLRENVFSMVQVDFLISCRDKNPRVAENIKKIRKLELIFDNRDYIRLVDTLALEKPTSGLGFISRMFHRKSKDQGRLVCSLQEAHSHLSIAALGQPYSSALDQNLAWQRCHQRHLQNMKEHLWGRTLTFVRQTFKLSRLYLELKHCVCVNGCCALAEKLPNWGWDYVWAYGLPKFVRILGVSGTDELVIRQIFNKQEYRDGLTEDDSDEEEDPAARYNGIFKAAYQQVLQEHGLFKARLHGYEE